MSGLGIFLLTFGGVAVLTTGMMLTGPSTAGVIIGLVLAGLWGVFIGSLEA